MTTRLEHLIMYFLVFMNC